MLFHEGEIPDFGSIQQKTENPNILYLIAEDIPKLNGMLTKTAAESYLPEGSRFGFHTGTLAFVVDHKTAGTGKIYAYHRGRDQWYEFSIRSDLGLFELMRNRHARILREIKEISGTPPLTFKSNGRPLKNYRIHGNTVNGESVGDRTANLFNPDSPWNMNGSHGKTSPYVFPKSTGDLKRTYFMTVNPGDVYTITSTVPGDRLYIYGYTTTMDPTAFTVNYPLYPDIMIRNNETVPNAAYTFTVPNGVVMISIYYSYEHLPTDFQIAEGSVSLSYEPYGYRVPVTVTNGTDTETINIYLDEPLAKSGGDTDCIDYADQKHYHSDGRCENAVLPVLPTFSGANTLTVNTTIQPVRTELTGYIKDLNS